MVSFSRVHQHNAFCKWVTLLLKFVTNPFIPFMSLFAHFFFRQKDWNDDSCKPCQQCLREKSQKNHDGHARRRQTGEKKSRLQSEGLMRCRMFDECRISAGPNLDWKLCQGRRRKRWANLSMRQRLEKHRDVPAKICFPPRKTEQQEFKNTAANKEVCISTTKLHQKGFSSNEKQHVL